MTNNKKILIVAPYGFNDRMANFIEFITARLLAKNNWQVVGLTRFENGAKTAGLLGDIKIHRYKDLARGICLLFKILFFDRPSVIHIHTLRNNRLGFISAILAKLTFTPFLFSEYGLLHDHYLVSDRDDPLGKELKRNGLVLNLKQIFTKSFIDRTDSFSANLKNYFFHWALTHARKIVFVSKHNLPIAQSLGLKNFIYLPYIQDKARWNEKKKEPEKTNQNESETAKKIERLQNFPFCLFIGQLKLRKGWDIYLKAIPLVPKEIMPFFAVVTSSAATPPEFFSALAKDLGVEDRIMFFGQASDQTLKKIYDLSSIVIVPSRYEGFGLVATEAFANQKPLIASAVEALTETVIDNENGLLVPPCEAEKLAQAICRLASDEDLKRKLVAGGKTTLARLESDELKNQWLDFYEKIIS